MRPALKLFSGGLNMVVEHRCDICRKKIKRNFVGERWNPHLDKFQIEVIVAKNDVWNEGDLCLTCLKRIVRTGKEIEKK
jgi:hypothetical protein